MPLSYEDCLKRGFLRRIPPSKDKAERSIKKSEKWLEEAGSTLKTEAFNSSVSAAYLAMFHAARSILFIDGFREKSHACAARYLEQYVKKGKLEPKWVDLLDHSREVRHEDQYDLSFFATKQEAEKALRSAGDFLSRIKKLVESIAS